MSSWFNERLELLIPRISYRFRSIVTCKGHPTVALYEGQEDDSQVSLPQAGEEGKADR